MPTPELCQGPRRPGARFDPEAYAWSGDLGDKLTREDLLSLAARLDRNEGPELLWELHDEYDVLSADAYAATGLIWSACEYPGHRLDSTSWRELFELSGYAVDGIRAPRRRPRRPMRLWRGSLPEDRAGGSWTARREEAASFAYGGLRGRPVGKIWTAMVEPWRLWARIDDRDEAEYVVDTYGLIIEEVGG